jgi:hypothetical protein
MTFIAGGAASLLSSVLYDKFHWQPIGILGICIVTIGGIIHLACQIGRGYSKEPPGPPPSHPEVPTEGSELESTGEGT